MSSAAVPVRKHSSAMKTSCRVISVSEILIPSSAAISKHDRARDSAQRAGGNWRREDLAMFDDEDVVRRAFRHIARIVQHQRFIRAGEIRFDSRHDVVQVVERLHRRIERGRDWCAVSRTSRPSDRSRKLRIG